MPLPVLAGSLVSPAAKTAHTEVTAPLQRKSTPYTEASSQEHHESQESKLLAHSGKAGGRNQRETILS